MNIIDKIKNLFSDNSVKGLIASYRLQSWWEETFTKEEQKRATKIYNPLGSSPNSLTKGDSSRSFRGIESFLSGLAECLNSYKEYDLAFRVVDKVESLLLSARNIKIDELHFIYHNLIKIYYKSRKDNPEALTKAIITCKKQILIAPKALKYFKKKWKMLPAHHGYEQLCIILEKRREYNEVIKLCNQALSQGWDGSWEKRIDRCVKKKYREYYIR